MEKRPRGRPALEETRDKVRHVRLTAEEDALIVEAAGLAKVPAARWIRERALEAARSKR